MVMDIDFSRLTLADDQYQYVIADKECSVKELTATSTLNGVVTTIADAHITTDPLMTSLHFTAPVTPEVAPVDEFFTAPDIKNIIEIRFKAEGAVCVLSWTHPLPEPPIPPEPPYVPTDWKPSAD